MFRNIENWFRNKEVVGRASGPSESEPTSHPEYARGSILESFEGRSLEAYIKEFNIKLEDLQGNTILDLGASLKNKFAEELKQRGVEAKVISLSPDFSDQTISQQTKEASPEGQLVAGLGQNLPFADNTFDKIYSLHAHEHFKTLQDVYNALKEMARTLKKGGIAKMGPIYDIPNYSHIFQQYSEDTNLKSLLAQYEVTFEREDVSPDLPPVKVKDDAANAFYVMGYCLVIRKNMKESSPTEAQ
ncbi:MAG: class I SAM-dependent methyltransferase [Candidatus Doudnabacteria bacterium]|jgi:SAM-dependent methyltransferase